MIKLQVPVTCATALLRSTASAHANIQKTLIVLPMHHIWRHLRPVLRIATIFRLREQLRLPLGITKPLLVQFNHLSAVAHKGDSGHEGRSVLI